jgi:colanic acid biosynthesis glycosyl transferase WcaI
VRILLVNRFLGGAQIPTGRMLLDVARRLEAAGHNVTVLASAGRYGGAAEARRDDGGAGVRAVVVAAPDWMPRSVAWLWFTWQARCRIPRMEWDACVLLTDPPLLPWLIGRLKRRRPEGAVAAWLMDLYPEALAASGRLSAASAFYRWLLAGRQQALGAGDLLICLGEAQKDRLGTALTDRVKTVVVPPWDERPDIASARAGDLRDIALYAGNLGEAHSFEAILAAAPHLPSSWTLRLAVRGAKVGALRAASMRAGAGARIEITGYVSESETSALLSSARVHLITMTQGWEGVVVPSKLYGCVRTGRPVLFLGPQTSDTACEIRRKGWGECLPPGADGPAVAAAILELASRPTVVAAPAAGPDAVADYIAGLRV